MRTILLAAIAAALLTTSAQAGIRIGSQLISEGDSPAKLIRYMGSPATKSFATVWCDRRKKAVCTKETWVYFHDDRQWTVVILNNEITDISWTR